MAGLSSRWYGNDMLKVPDKELLSPEIRALCAFVQPVLKRGSPAAAIPDRRLLRWATTRHRIGPLLHAALPADAPTETSDRRLLEDAYRANQTHQKLSLLLLTKLEKSFSNAGVQIGRAHV